jgi:protein tyrosine phosphatase
MSSRLTKKRNVTKSQVKVSNAKHHLTKKHINRKSQTRKTKLYKVRKGDKAKKTVQKGGLVCKQPKRGILKKLFGKKKENDTYIPMDIECFKSKLLKMLNTRKLIMLKLLKNRTIVLEKIKIKIKSKEEENELQEIKTKLNNVDNLYIHPYDDLIYRLYFKIPIKDECYSKTTDPKKIKTNPYKNIVTLLNLESYEKMSRMTRTFKDFIEEYNFLVEYENDKKMKDKIKEQLNSLEFYNYDYCYKPKNEKQVSSSLKTVVLSPTTHPVLHLETNLVTHDITHIWFTDWPDHGVPETMNLFHSFITYVYDDMKKNGGNTVIHCSAGIGRTGVVYMVLFLLNMGYTPKLAMSDNKNINTNIKKLTYAKLFEVINTARTHRYGLVQTPDQYNFIYSYFVNEQEESNYLQQFKSLNLACNKDSTKKPTQFRYSDFLPCSEHVVELPLTTTTPTTTPTYIHASKMKPLQFENTVVPIITAECPKNNNENFYTMLDSYDIKRIIMVTGLVENGKAKCDNYFNFENNMVQYNNKPITLTKPKKESWGIIHTLSFYEQYQQQKLSALPISEGDGGDGGDGDVDL